MSNSFGRYKYEPVTIAESATDSDIVAMQDYTVVGIEMPAALTGTSISFLAGETAASVLPVNNIIDTLVTVPAGSSTRKVSINSDDFLGSGFVQIKSNDTEAAARTFILIGYKP